jgi:hypothetical protein
VGRPGSGGRAGASEFVGSCDGALPADLGYQVSHPALAAGGYVARAAAG